MTTASLIAEVLDRTQTDGVVRFRDFADCVFIADRETLKLFAPKSVRRLGGQSTDRVLSGYIGFALRAELGPLREKRRLGRPPSLTVCAIENLPELFRHAALREGEVSREFADELRWLLQSLPATRPDIEAKFGADFLSKPSIDRVRGLADFLRSVSVPKGTPS